ncbi:hypothetical protein KVF89_22330 [Nocardioides carbamazepini]|uniref:hypothetical protein n=1 Tax=Nocardioides carbamazepini TaxID=2854259 RepID=UPI002149BAF2|nr:hypothetical protein [Nocardioides carbamazepini]MCR1785294.1 hypothetical protein [Nocardioides carbamazepini]
MTRRTVTRPEVRVGGFWLSTIVPQGWGALEHKTRTNGSWEASWVIPPNPFVRNWRHPALVYGALVEIMLGPIVIWSGTLEEPDWDEGRFIAIGASRDAETAMSLDGSGNSSTTPNTVIDAAIARGVLSWTRGVSFGTTPIGDADSGLVTVRSVLDVWAQKNSSRWLVNEQRQLTIAPTDESDPKWYVAPGSGVLGSASEDRVDRVFVRFTNVATGAQDIASYPASTPTGGIEAPKDLVTGRAPMTLAAAQAEAASIWNEQQGRSGWTNGLTLTRGQVTTKGGGIADLALIKAGDAIRLLGVPDARGVAHNTTIVIGDTDYDWTDDEIQINPVGLAARDPESALERVNNLAVDAMAAATSGGSSEIAGYASSSPVNGGNIVLGINSGDIEIAKWMVPAPPAGAVRAYINASVNARCQYGNQAVGYKLWWSGNGGAVWVEIATSYVHNHNDAIQALGTSLSAFVDFPPGLTANQIQFRLLAATGGGAGVTNFGMVNMNAVFFTR